MFMTALGNMLHTIRYWLMPFPTLLANRKGNSCLSSCMMGLRTIAQGEIIDNRFRNHLFMVVNGTRCEVRPPGFAS